jgi:putative CocE/NonD family hydrolase
MRIVADFPHRVREIEHVWIPMPDGIRLSARLWLPEDAAAHPVPAILEYVPYRKRDLLRARDEPMHRWFAGHGYAAVRLDVRGSGESEGVLTDEYTQAELDDGVAAIAWIAAQRWCSGAVGMMGKSWGGFNALQIAALRPPALKAVVTVCSTDDRYADDAHYMGGALITDNFSWGSAFFNLCAQPPDPALVGEAWRAMWRERLEAAHPHAATWLAHQRRDGYWRHGSVNEDFGAIDCAVYAMGGWADAYSNAVPRLLAGLNCPRKGLVGPWGHLYAHDGAPGPAIGYLQECARWWERWLLGRDNGIMDEPAYRVWMQEGVAPAPTYETRPGRWVAEERWPSPRVEARRLPLAEGRIAAEDANVETRALAVCSPLTVGLAAGSWISFGGRGDQPLDQRIDDGGSLVFDGETLSAPLEILGAPTLDLEIACDKPVALLCARLSDVAPDGTATRVTYGLLNLTHRDSHEQPAPLTPGARVRARVVLNDIAHAFAVGHRLRVSISTSYWPIAWPAPEAGTVTVFAGSSALELPVRPPRAGDAALAAFDEPESAPGPRETELSALNLRRAIDHELGTGEIVHASGIAGDDLEAGMRRVRLDDLGLEYGHATWRRLRIDPRDPLSATAENRARTEFARDGWRCATETRMKVSADARAFRVEAEMTATEGETIVFERRWDLNVPRDLS